MLHILTTLDGLHHKVFLLLQPLKNLSLAGKELMIVIEYTVVKIGIYAACG